jgi:Na+-transporting methylmalonyl-CoA/oxaloacetate decarboxylase gamma subunit
MFMLLFCSFFLVLVVCFSNKTNRFVQKCQQSRQLHNKNNNNNNNNNENIVIRITIDNNNNKKDVSNSAIERLRGDD